MIPSITKKTMLIIDNYASKDVFMFVSLQAMLHKWISMAQSPVMLVSFNISIKLFPLMHLLQ